MDDLDQYKLAEAVYSRTVVVAQLICPFPSHRPRASDPACGRCVRTTAEVAKIYSTILMEISKHGNTTKTFSYEDAFRMAAGNLSRECYSSMGDRIKTALED